MSILSGIKKVIPYFKNADGNYEQLSYKTSSQTVDFDDGKTAETKLGAIKGITTSTSVTETGYAADAKTVSEINQSLENNKVLFSEIGIETRTYPIGVTSINVTDLMSQHEKDGYVRIINVYPTQNFLLATVCAHPVPGTNVIERYITIDNRYTSPIAAALTIDITYIPT